MYTRQNRTNYRSSGHFRCCCPIRTTHATIRTMNKAHQKRLARIVSEGGKRLNLIISAEANRALARLASDKTETAAIEAALIRMDRENNT